jgi:membrane-associated protease RseP (regulator of RpoE activity)
MSDSSTPIPTDYPFHDRPASVYYISRPRYWVHILLLLATFFTTLTVGAKFQSNFMHHQSMIGDDFPFPLLWVLRHPANLLLGIPFALSLMGILLAHEMGHYLYCRKYHVQATLPFFLPAPTLIGTLGAFIRIKSPIRTRKALFDIGIGGPIAGFVVAVPLMFLGLMLSAPITVEPNGFGFPLIFYLAHRVCGPALPLAQMQLHPIAIAAWFGMFATSLNLLPGGQLDGGHIVASVSPATHRSVTWATVAVLLLLAWYYFLGWLLWCVFVIVARRHPWVPQRPTLGPRRLLLALLGMVMLILTVAPRPFDFQDRQQEGLAIREILYRNIPQLRNGEHR